LCVCVCVCVCVCGGGGSALLRCVHSLLRTAGDTKWPHVAVVWVAILFRIRVVSNTDLAPTPVYPELASFFFILNDFSNIKLVLQIRLRPLFLINFPLAVLLCDRKMYELLITLHKCKWMNTFQRFICGLLKTVTHFGLGTEIHVPSDSNKLGHSHWRYRLRFLLPRIEPLSFSSCW
jgi:hypothetical protein